MLDEEDDDGTMLRNVSTLSRAVVGHRIVKVERNVNRSVTRWRRTRSTPSSLVLTLDDGSVVTIRGTNDCCAYTELDDVIEHLPHMDHIITNVTASEGYDRWHILADMGEVLELEVGWSCGNPFYYAYGFEINVIKETD